jgi:hypothetical protein
MEDIMYAQFTYFDGPRSAELTAASRRAGKERIQPAITADEQLAGQLVAVFVCQRTDGSEVVISVMRTRAAFDRAREVIMSTELLPGEDPALLSEPDRIEIIEVIDSFLPIGQLS